MSNTLIAESDDLPRRTPHVGEESRDAERAITVWEERTFRDGASLIAAFKSCRHQAEWGYRFLISGEEDSETAVFIDYGLPFARLLKLPERPCSVRALLQQLPSRYCHLFAAGCGDAIGKGAAVRFQGAVARCDGKLELYRAAFFPVSGPCSMRSLIFGSFNYRALPQENAYVTRSMYDRMERQGATAGLRRA